jgi:MoxR-like ATPase
MYKLENLTPEQLAILKANKDYYNDYKDIKAESFDFSEEEEFSLKLDEIIYNWILENEPDEKELPKRKFDLGNIVIRVGDKNETLYAIAELTSYDTNESAYYYEIKTLVDDPKDEEFFTVKENQIKVFFEKKKPKPKFKEGDRVLWSKTKNKIYDVGNDIITEDFRNGEWVYAIYDEDNRQYFGNESDLKKTTRKNKTEPRPKPKFKDMDQVWYLLDGDRVYGMIDGDPYYNEAASFYVYNVGFLDQSEKIIEESFLNKRNKNETKTKTMGAKSKGEIIKELLEQLSESEENINIEQVTAIVTNIVDNHKVCYENLCDDVVKAIKDTRKVTLYTPDGIKLGKDFNNSIPNILRIIDDITIGHNVMLIGGAGTGKTYLAGQVAQILNREMETINCNQFTSPIEINGGQTIEGYQEGKLIRAWSEGKLLILDELPKLDPNTAGILNEALAKTNLKSTDKNAFITNTRGDVFQKKEGFGVIATGNVYPNTENSAYGANNKQDLSLLDRFAGSVYEIEKNPEFEKTDILPGHLFLWVISDTIRTLIEVNKWEAQVSIRFMTASLRAYLFEMRQIKLGSDMTDRKTYKDVIDSFLYTFTEVQQIEIKRDINYSTLFAEFQYRELDINKNPL